MGAQGCFGIRAEASLSSAVFADLAIRGFAISFMTLARVALLGCSFFAFACRIQASWH
jgi:hypothetical protein